MCEREIGQDSRLNGLQTPAAGGQGERDKCGALGCPGLAYGRGPPRSALSKPRRVDALEETPRTTNMHHDGYLEVPGGRPKQHNKPELQKNNLYAKARSPITSILWTIKKKRISNSNPRNCAPN